MHELKMKTMQQPDCSITWNISCKCLEYFHNWTMTEIMPMTGQFTNFSDNQIILCEYNETSNSKRRREPSLLFCHLSKNWTFIVFLATLSDLTAQWWPQQFDVLRCCISWSSTFRDVHTFTSFMVTPLKTSEENTTTICAMTESLKMLRA